MLCSLRAGCRCPQLARRCLSSQSRRVAEGGSSEKDFRPKKALLVRKVTRYEYEKFYLKPELSEAQLQDYIATKGSDYNAMRLRHDEYFRYVDDLQTQLVKRGLECRTVHRYDFHASLIHWADVIFTAGGDGTFLMVASNIHDSSKPVVGINADPLRSEGFLCLPKCFSHDVGRAIDRVCNGEFRWLWRKRLRLTANGLGGYDVPVNLHNQQMLFSEHQFWERVLRGDDHGSSATAHHPQSSVDLEPHVLPVLALNEVYIGETLSSRVSFYELKVDDGSWQKQKSSGIIICPGTGSTSWHLNVNHVSFQEVQEILRVAQQKKEGGGVVDADDSSLIDAVVTDYNNALVFGPSEDRMAFTIRDPLTSGVFQVQRPRGFCNRLGVRSRMWDACIVVDGTHSFTFNDGAVIDVDMSDACALRCVYLGS